MPPHTLRFDVDEIYPRNFTVGTWARGQAVTVVIDAGTARVLALTRTTVSAQPFSSAAAPSSSPTSALSSSVSVVGAKASARLVPATKAETSAGTVLEIFDAEGVGGGSSGEGGVGGVIGQYDGSEGGSGASNHLGGGGGGLCKPKAHARHLQRKQLAAGSRSHHAKHAAKLTSLDVVGSHAAAGCRRRGTGI